MNYHKVFKEYLFNADTRRLSRRKLSREVSPRDPEETQKQKLHSGHADKRKFHRRDNLRPSALDLRKSAFKKLFKSSYDKIISNIRSALKEDIGRRDITTELTISPHKVVKAVLLAKENCVVCGLDIAGLVFKTKDNKTKFKSLVKDGQFIKKGEVLAKIQGKASSVLTAERVALNFLSLLSGIATQTKKYVEKVRPYQVKIMDTRKTIPGLRELQKYAVRVGGGYNHRMRLDEMVLVKDNHIQVIGHRSWVIGLKEIRKKILPQTKIEVEVKNLKEFKQVLEINPDIVMLDNMSIKDIKKAVKIRNNLRPITYDLRPKLEASGGITLENVRKVASCGVDMISIGELTHSLKSMNISLEVINL